MATPKDIYRLPGVSLEVGDTAWAHGVSGDDDNPREPGKIVHKFQHGTQTLYVLEYETSMDPVYEVRDSHMLSDSADKPIAMWRRRED